VAALHGLGDAAAHEGGFAGAGNSGEDGEAAEGDFDVDVFEVVGGAAFELKPVFFGFEDFAAFASTWVDEGICEGLDGGGIGVFF